MTAIIPRILDLSINDVRQGYKTNTFSAVDLVRTYIARIEEVNQQCRAVIEINPDAIQLAEECDNARKQGSWKGSLHGVPVLVKDLFNTNDRMETTAGSLALKGTRLGIESTAIRKLREAGAIVLGTTNLTEWANFRSRDAPNGWSARGGQGLGPYCDMQDPAGSSSGSAVAARLGLATVCLGTENNGSITSPCSKAAVVGLKPTVGRVSTEGMWPANKYQDSPGPIGRTVTDVASVLSIIAAHSETESINGQSSHEDQLDFSAGFSQQTLFHTKLAIPRDSIYDSVKDKEVLEQFDKTLELLCEFGAKIVDDVKYSSWTRAWNQESMDLVYGQLKKQVGIYFQQLQVNPHNIQSLSDLITFTQREPLERYEEFGASVFEKANAVNLSDDELAALFDRRRAKGSEIDEILDSHQCDALVVPAHCHNPSDLAQAPVLCLPMGFFSAEHPVEKNSAGLVTKGPNIPFGILFIGRKWSETTLLRIGYAYEYASASRRKKHDSPAIMPVTEVTDILREKPGRNNFL